MHMSKDVSVSLAISHAKAWQTILTGEHHNLGNNLCMADITWPPRKTIKIICCRHIDVIDRQSTQKQGAFHNQAIIQEAFGICSEAPSDCDGELTDMC